MTIAESVRLSILELSSKGISVRQIAEETGVSKNTVSRVLKNGDTVPKIVTQAHAHATKGMSPKCPQKTGTENGDSLRPATVIEVRTITRDLTISELFDLLQTAKADLALARASNDGSRDGIMAVTACAKVVTEILKQMGRWCGLDDTLTEDTRRDVVDRSDVESMTLDEMRDLVARL